ncbi:hypothetical protein JRQ81_011419 [Phrynocephalus forsythii]|uniref:Uncharacterized protein n=1 Tax=Phrynocephalus forsythii TaxID=171643 RepID=A0A9Q1B5L2_9SAUR|nr:hypothetical protein JRQ81_011419 [Phrynocephalus forsythii]
MMGVEVFKAKRKEENLEDKTETVSSATAGQVQEEIDLECEAKKNNQLPMQREDELNGQPAKEFMETSIGENLSSSDKIEKTKNAQTGPCD